MTTSTRTESMGLYYFIAALTLATAVLQLVLAINGISVPQVAIVINSVMLAYSGIKVGLHWLHKFQSAKSVED